MPEPSSQETTQILARLSDGDAASASRLFPLIYDRLRALAGRHFRRQKPGHTLQPTALVHEVYLRLVDQKGARWKDRAHFFAVAATAMRQILINHARDRKTAKRGGGRPKLPLDEALDAYVEQEVDLISLDDALSELSKLSERKGRIVELRFFAGLTVEEIAHVLGVSKTTVESDWRMARAWLSKQLSEDDSR